MLLAMKGLGGMIGMNPDKTPNKPVEEIVNSIHNDASSNIPRYKLTIQVRGV